jgi:GTPase Era involved in 16S rRNA processing
MKVRRSTSSFVMPSETSYLHCLCAELPYELQIQPEALRTLHDGSCRIEQTILVPTDSVRKIVVGKKGAAIGSIGR